MKRSIILCLIFTLIFSSFAYAMEYSENGYIDGEASQSVTKTLFYQDFENTGYDEEDAIKDRVIADSAYNSLKPRLSSTYAKGEYSLKTGMDEKYTTTNTTGGGVSVYTGLNTSTSPKFVDGKTYTISVDVYFVPEDASVTEKTAQFYLRGYDGTTHTNNYYEGGKTVYANQWNTVSCTYEYDADTFGTDTLVVRFDVMKMYCGEFFYTDNVRITYTEEETEKIEVPWLSFEDFESNPLYSATANSSQIIGIGGNSFTKPTTGVIEFENAKSGSHVAALIGKSTGVKDGGSISVGTSYRLKFYNLFNQKTRTPLNGTAPTWTQGWEMFTEDDIGRLFEISVWVYADSSYGTYPVGNTQAAVDGYISGKDIDVNNKETYPSLSVGLNGPGSDTKNDSQSYEYGGNPKSAVTKKVKWNEWTEFKVYYEVTADTIYDATQSSNPLVNAIGVNTVDGDYYPCTYYVDDIKVKEIKGVIPSFSLVSNNKVALDILVPDGIIDTTKDQILIAGIYDATTQNLIDAAAVSDISGETVACQLDVEFGADVILKMFIWDGTTLVPYVERTINEIPALNDLKAGITIDRIAQSFYGDEYTQKGFNWYTTNLFTSEICYVEKTGETPDWTNAKYETATSTNQRHFDFNNYSSIRHKAVVKNLEPNTEYYYRVGSKEFNVWSDTYTFRTVDDSTTDGLVYLLADPQSSTYAGAAPKAVMMDYIYETYPGGDFILSAGDNVITYNKEQEWIDIFEAGSFANPNVTFNGTPGDHDTAGRKDGEYTKEQPYSKHFNYPVPEDASKGITYYSFDYKDMHIAIIDTTMLSYDGTDGGNSETEQLDWLRADMNASDKKWKVVITHEQPQDNSLISSTTSGASYRRKKSLMPVFSELGIDLVLGGDTHIYSRTYPIVGLGGDLDSTTKKVVPFEGKTELGNPNPTIVKTETINGKTTKFFDATEGVTYMTLGSVATNNGTYEADSINPEVSLIPTYDVLAAEGIDVAQLSGGVTTYTILTKVGNDLIFSIYHFDLDNPEAGGELFDQFALTKE